MSIYIFMAKGEGGNFSMDNGKSARDNETIELDDEDLKRKDLQDMIKNGEENKLNTPRLILAKDAEEVLSKEQRDKIQQDKTSREIEAKEAVEEKKDREEAKEEAIEKAKREKKRLEKLKKKEKANKS